MTRIQIIKQGLVVKHVASKDLRNRFFNNLRRLRSRLCEAAFVVPTDLRLDNNDIDLVDPSDQPTVRGGFAAIYQGTLTNRSAHILTGSTPGVDGANAVAVKTQLVLLSQAGGDEHSVKSIAKVGF